MLRLLRAPKWTSTKQILRTYKTQELDEPAYHIKPLNQYAIDLMKRFGSDIHYSSYVETNKIPLSFKDRKKLYANLQKEKFRAEFKKIVDPTSSILLETIKNEDSVKSVKAEQSPETPLPNEPDEDIESKTDPRKILLNKSKLKILTEMGLRRSALEFEVQSFPDNWMQDYETYNESDTVDVLVDSHYGTPGNHILTAVSISMDIR